MEKLFDTDVLAQLAEEEEVQLRAGDTDHRPTTLWCVVVDDQVYIRSWKRSSHSWYEALQTVPTATLYLSGDPLAVEAVPEQDDAINQAVDRAFEEKYDRRWPKYVTQMKAPAAVATTTRLQPM